jgi:hypothetical protein
MSDDRVESGGWYMHTCGERAWIATAGDAPEEGCDACESASGGWVKDADE